jgi:hypothetical protein
MPTAAHDGITTSAAAAEPMVIYSPHQQAWSSWTGSECYDAEASARERNERAPWSLPSRGVTGWVFSVERNRESKHESSCLIGTEVGWKTKPNWYASRGLGTQRQSSGVLRLHANDSGGDGIRSCAIRRISLHACVDRWWEYIYMNGWRGKSRGHGNLASHGGNGE